VHLGSAPQTAAQSQQAWTWHARGMHFLGTCRDKLAFGEVRGGNTALASAFGVKTLPALLAVCNGDAATREAYSGDMKSDPIRGFLDQFAGGKRCRQVRS
jgi:hypothetical protein